MSQLKRLNKADQTKIIHAISSLIEAGGGQISASGFDDLLRPARELAASPCVTGSDRSRAFIWVGSLAKAAHKQKENYMFFID